jgi:hypothetical protein
MSSTPRFSTASSLDVVGIGNAIVDVLVQAEDQVSERSQPQQGQHGPCR